MCVLRLDPRLENITAMTYINEIIDKNLNMDSGLITGLYYCQFLF